MRLLAVILTWLSAFPDALAWQETQEEDRREARFQVSVEAVYLNVVVIDYMGRFHPGLKAEDFEVLEDGTPQAVTFFTAATPPVATVLLLDSSSSIQHSLEGVKAAASNFLLRLGEGDKVTIAFFNQGVHFVCPFTGDRNLLMARVRSMRAGGATAIYDAVLASLQRLSGLDDRTALLVFSDGADSRPAKEGSQSDMNDALEAGRRSEVSIYTIGFLGASPAGYDINRGFLRTLAQESGGRAFFPKGTEELNVVFSQIQSELHSQYRIAYVSNHDGRDGAWRDIEVRIRGSSGLRARTRRGYYAKPR